MEITLTKNEAETAVKALEQFIKVYDGYEMNSTLATATTVKQLLLYNLKRLGSETRAKAQEKAQRFYAD